MIDEHTEDDLARELRDHFERRAAASVPPPLPVGLLHREARQDRVRRIGLAVAAAVAAVLAAGGGLRLATGPSTVNPGVTSGPSDWAGLRVATAGDLAGDRSWVSAARERTAAIVANPVAHVVFAGRLPVGAAFIVATGPDAQTVSLYSPSGKAADLAVPDTTWRGAGSVRLDGEEDDVSLAVTAPDGSRLFAVVPFEDRRVEVSPGASIDRSATVHRTWTEVPLRHGAAVGRFPAADLQLPQLRLDGGRDVAFLASQLATPETARHALAQRFGPRWTIGPPPDERLLDTALSSLGDVVDLRTVDLEPVLHGREQPSTADVLAAVVHLPGGGNLQVVSTFDDRDPDELVSSTPVVGRAVPAGRVPVGWLDDVSSGPGVTTHARARVAFRGAARVELRDTRTTPCAPGRTTFGRGVPDANGLTTMVVDLPESCLDTVRADVELAWGFTRIQAIAYDATGRELGRGPISKPWDGYLPGQTPTG